MSRKVGDKDIMSANELQKYTLKSKYARFNQKRKRRETYDEAINRVRVMMIGQYPEAEEHINWAYDQIREERCLGSQRALQFGGTPVLRHNARIFNCTASYADRLRFFQEAFYLLLCGSGTGFSVQKHHIAKLPYLSAVRRGGESLYLYNNRKIWRDGTEGDSRIAKSKFVVPDTIEGWADAAGVLISSYFENPVFLEYAECDVEFDYSQIRPEGSPLSSGAGKAPGPEPLRRALEKVRTLLDACIARGQSRLRPIDAYDIVMHLSDAVLAGGVRRSATICVFSPDDEEMLNAKTGDWFVTNPQRGRSNNSVLLVRDKTTKAEFERLMNSVKEWGEPGFIWADNTEFMPNPCVEIGLYPSLQLPNTHPLLQSYQGPVGHDSPDTVTVSGWQFCNLSTINGRKIRTKEDFFRACKAAAIIGTLQAGFTKFPYLGGISEEITKREALLGVSITGIMDSPDILLNPAVLREGAQIVLDTNKFMAGLIGINPCARATCIKPEGTASMLLGTLASGVHCWPFKRGIRHVQANRNEAPYKFFAAINPDACEPSVYCANKRTDVISFPIEAPETAFIKDQFSAIDFLSTVKMVFENWVRPGKRPDCCVKPWLEHNVSNTVSVKPDEWQDVADYIYDNRYSFCGISLIQTTGDKDYRQAPNVSVYNPGEIQERYGLDPSSYHEIEQLTKAGFELFHGDVFAACDTLAAADRNEAMNLRLCPWIASILSFADSHLNGDRKTLEYAIKDIFYWKKYIRLVKTIRAVDYNLLIEEEDDTRPTEEVSCAGGACAI